MGHRIQLGSMDAVVKAQNAEFYASDLQHNTGFEGDKVEIDISISAAADVEITFDSGTTWDLLNGGTDLAANALYHFEFSTRKGDLINFRIPTAGGATVRRMRVDLVKA